MAVSDIAGRKRTTRQSPGSIALEDRAPPGRVTIADVGRDAGVRNQMSHHPTGASGLSPMGLPKHRGSNASDALINL